MASADGRARRTTRQKTLIHDAVDEAVFRSAQDIHEVLRAADQRVGMATVYRNLQSLADAGMVDTVTDDDGATLYRHCEQHHHHHLICRRCLRAVEIDAPAVEQWIGRTAADHGFVEVAHTVEVFGVCPECAREER